jgi:hypothetical protein
LATGALASACGGSQATGEVVSSVTPAEEVPGSGVVANPIVLRRDGLGVVDFGQPADESAAAVTAVLGEPDRDTGWVDPLSISSCAGTETRVLNWGDLALYFSDESGVANGQRHLFAYSYGSVEDLETTPEGLATPEGIGLGTTVEFLRAAYPDVVVEEGGKD